MGERRALEIEEVICRTRERHGAPPPPRRSLWISWSHPAGEASPDIADAQLHAIDDRGMD
jgi:hypothetical protein